MPLSPLTHSRVAALSFSLTLLELTAGDRLGRAALLSPSCCLLAAKLAELPTARIIVRHTHTSRRAEAVAGRRLAGKLLVAADAMQAGRTHLSVASRSLDQIDDAGSGSWRREMDLCCLSLGLARPGSARLGSVRRNSDGASYGRPSWAAFSPPPQIRHFHAAGGSESPSGNKMASALMLRASSRAPLRSPANFFGSHRRQPSTLAAGLRVCVRAAAAVAR